MSLRAMGAAIVLVCVMGAGCNSTCDPNNAGGMCMTGERCYIATACASGHCESTEVGGFCAAPCEGPSDCAPDEYCTRTITGTSACSGSCIGTLIGDPERFCHAGVAVTCETTPDPGIECERCGCPVGQECLGCDTGSCYCGRIRELGEACVFNDHCRTGNCVGPTDSRRCELAPGTACGGATSTECSRCDDSGMTCRQGCIGRLECESNELCLGNRSTSEYWCYIDCSDSAAICPAGTTCDDTADFTDRYCRPSP